MAIGDPCTGGETDYSWEAAFCQKTTNYCSQFSSTCTSGTGWTNASNAQADNGLFATASVQGATAGDCVTDPGQASPWQMNTGYGFNLPSDAVVQYFIIGVKAKQPPIGVCSCPMVVGNYGLIVNGTLYAAAAQICITLPSGGWCNEFGPIPNGAAGTNGVSGTWPHDSIGGATVCEGDVEGVLSSQNGFWSCASPAGVGDYALAKTALSMPTLTPALVNASNFGAAVLVASNCTDIRETVSLDAIGIGIYYTAANCAAGPANPIVGGINGVTRQVFNVFSKRTVWWGR